MTMPTLENSLACDDLLNNFAYDNPAYDNLGFF